MKIFLKTNLNVVMLYNCFLKFILLWYNIETTKMQFSYTVMQNIHNFILNNKIYSYYKFYTIIIQILHNTIFWYNQEIELLHTPITMKGKYDCYL